MADFFRYRPLFELLPIGWRIVTKTTNTAPITVQYSTVQYKQQVNPLLLIHNYTLLVISRNDKNKLLTIIKPTKTRSKREKYTFCNIKSLEHLKIKKMAPASV